MPIRLKVQFVCEAATVCTSNGGGPNAWDWSISTTPTVIGLEQALKEMPPEWDRKDGVLRCPSCVKGPPNLNTVG